MSYASSLSAGLPITFTASSRAMIPLFESLYEIVLGRPVLGAIAGVIAFCGLALFFRKDELEKVSHTLLWRKTIM